MKVQWAGLGTSLAEELSIGQPEYTQARGGHTSPMQVNEAIPSSIS